MMKISVVIPVYNEEESILPLYEAILKAMNKYKYAFEIIFVDDGSSDNSFLKLRQICSKDNRVVAIKLKGNHGQTAALHAGLQYTKGDIIVTMDGDLQNDPDDIDKFVKELNKGNDIVLGWRYNRHDRFFSRKLPSKIANWLIRKITGLTIKDNGCAIRAYKGSFVKRFPMYSEMHRLMPVMTALAGAKYSQIKVKHHERKFGYSKYGLSRIYKVLIDMFSLKFSLTNFKYPFYGFGLVSVLSFLVSLLFFGLMVNNLYNAHEESIIIYLGVTALFSSLGIFLLFLGIISSLSYYTGDIKIDNLKEKLW